MKKLFKSNDSITEASALIALSCMPFYALGQLGAAIPMWISYILGGAALLLFVLRLCGILFAGMKPCVCPRVGLGLKSIIGFALPLGVTEGIVEYATGKTDLTCYIFAGIIFLVGIAIMFIPERKAEQ